MGERNLFWNFPSYNSPKNPARCPRTVLRRGDWKIHHRYEDNGYELYNLKEDIGESKDLSKTRPKVFEMMRKELDASYERFGAVKSLPANPQYNAKEAEAERAKLTPETLPPAMTSAQAYKLLR